MDQRYNALVETHGRMAAENQRLSTENESLKQVSGDGEGLAGLITRCAPTAGGARAALLDRLVCTPRARVQSPLPLARVADTGRRQK